MASGSGPTPRGAFRRGRHAARDDDTTDLIAATTVAPGPSKPAQPGRAKPAPSNPENPSAPVTAKSDVAAKSETAKSDTTAVNTTSSAPTASPPTPPATPGRPTGRRGRPARLADRLVETFRARPEAVEQVGGRQRIAFVDIGRALAAVLVVYSHVDWVLLAGHGLHLALFDWLDRWFVVPLGFGAQGPGGLSVPVFFLISGYVVTPIATRMGAARFAVNRVLRVFPLLFFALAISLLVVWCGQSPLVTGNPRPVTVGKILSNALLYNFLSKPIDAYVGVAWTLLIECLFYLLLIALAPLLRRAPVLAILVQFDLIVGVFLTHDWFGPNYAALAANAGYLLVPLLGQVLWASRHRQLPVWVAGVFVVLGWLLFLWGGRADFDPDYILRPYPVAAALVVMLLGLFAERRLRQRRFWVAMSERSYSIYLLHGAVVFPVVGVLHGPLPLWAAVLVGLLCTVVAVEVSYRFVERPSHRLGRRLSRGSWRRPGARSAR